MTPGGCPRIGIVARECGIEPVLPFFELVCRLCGGYGEEMMKGNGFDY